MLDTWVRVSLSELMRTTPTHLLSAFDEDPDDLQTAAEQLQHGYTEWSAPGPRTLSFGWDWRWEPQQGRLMADWANLRTNLRLLDEQGQEMNIESTLVCVERWMEQAQWAQITQLALGLGMRHGEALP